MKGKTSAVSFILCSITIVLFTVSAYGGQVVTDTQRAWARNVLEQVEEDKALPAASSTDSIGVLYYHNQSGNFEWDPLQKGMAIMLNHDLNKIGYKIDVVERVKIQALLEELGMGASGLLEPSAAPRIGRLLETQYLSQGDLLKGETTPLQINPAFLTIPTEDTLIQPEVVGDINELIRMEKAVLFDIIEQMQIQLTPDERTMLGKPLSDNPAALMAYFKGVDHSDNGEYEKAAELYKQALVEDPNLTPAQDAVEELEKLKLVEPEEPPPPEEEEMSTTKKVLIGAGAALAVGAIVGGAVAGAVYAADALSDDDDDGGSGGGAAAGGGGAAPGGDDGGGDDEDAEETDTVRPEITHTTPVARSTVECKQGEVFVHWSEPMDPDSGWVAAGPPGWKEGDAWILDWSGDLTTLRIYWEHDDAICAGAWLDETLILEMNKYQDVSGNPQTGVFSFKFRVVDTIP